MPARKQDDSMRSTHRTKPGAETGPGRDAPKKPDDYTFSRREFLFGTGASVVLLLAGISPAAGEKGRPVQVGFILPEQGPAARDCASLLAGFDAYLRENAGASVEVIRKDSGPADEKTLEALADLLMKKQVQFLICPPTLEGTEKVLGAWADSKAVAFVTHPSVRLVAGELCLPSSFRVRPNTYQAAYPLGSWAVRNIGGKVFISGDDDAQGNEEADFFAHAFERAGGSFGDRVMVPVKSGEIKAVVETLKKTAPNLIFASFRDKAAEDFLKTLRQGSGGISVPVLGPESLTAFPTTLTGLGKASAGVKTLTTLRDPHEFEALVKKHTGKQVHDAARAAEGYDIAQIIVRASKDVLQEKSDFQTLLKYIEEMEIEGPRGKIRFDKNHEPILEFMVQEWEQADRSFKRKVVAELGPRPSLDFGCGRVGFPKKPEGESKGEEESGWLDHEE